MAPKSPPPLRIALVGMSGAGKSFWTKRLSEPAAIPASPATTSSKSAFARTSPPRDTLASTVSPPGWVGPTARPTHNANPDATLSAEIAVLDDLLSELERDSQRELVLDTTGSVIYAGNNILMRLRRQMTVVYLAAAPQERELYCVGRYLSDPKPVLWRGAFQPKSDETPRDTVARCYPKLAAARRQSYEALAHCTLPVASLHRVSSQDVDARNYGELFLDQIRAELGKRNIRANGL